MVALTFPDGARREFPDAITGLDIGRRPKNSNLNMDSFKLDPHKRFL